MKKNAVVLGGGGSKGAYEVGVFKALKKLNYSYDIITGTSVGSINGAVISQGDFSLCEKFWKNINTSDVFDLETDSRSPELLREYAKSAFGNNGLSYNNLKNNLTLFIDEEKLRKSDIEFGLVTVKFPSMTPLYIYKEDMEKGKVIDYILASAACFPAMKPHKIGNQLYIDGGYNDNIPIDMAIEKGATTIVAVDLNAIGVVKNKKYDNVKIIKVESYCDLGNFLVFDKNIAKKNIKLGYLDTLKAFKKAEGYRYTFKTGETSKIISDINHISEDMFYNFKKNNKRLLPVINKTIKKTLNTRGKSSKDLSKKEYSVLIYESLMEFLSIPNFEIYTKKKCDFLIKKNFKNIKTDNIKKLDEIINNLKLSGDILKKLDELSLTIKNIEKTEIIKFICDNINLEDKKVNHFLALLSLVSPLEFSCGVYMYIFNLK